MKPRLDPRIMGVLRSKLKSTSETAIRCRVFRIRKKHGITLNAAAQILAEKEGFSVMRYLGSEDIDSLRQARADMEKIGVTRRPLLRMKRKERIKIIARYITNDKFLKVHLDEINRTYTYKCYTATFVLCRKVLENLLIKILMKKYPLNTREHREKYFDFNRGRCYDLGTLLQNLGKTTSDFGPYSKLVKRIIQLASKFKETADEMTHSLYHIANKKEIDEKNFQGILDLIQELEGKIG